MISLDLKVIGKASGSSRGGAVEKGKEPTELVSVIETILMAINF